jgi:hypothetical protein
MFPMVVPLPQGMIIKDVMNQKGSRGTGLDEELHPPQMGCNFPTRLSFCPWLFHSHFWNLLLLFFLRVPTCNMVPMLEEN